MSTITAKERDELLERLFTAEEPELFVGLPEGRTDDALYVIIPLSSGTGVAMKGLSARAVVLLKKLIGGEE